MARRAHKRHSLDSTTRMPITANLLATFLFAYARSYREAHARATTPPPSGPGYPRLPCSPFLVASVFDAYITENGVVIDHQGKEPGHQWFIAGGPALKVDYEPTRTPPRVNEILKAEGLIGKPIGIYRIVAKTPMRQSVWRGRVLGVAREVTISDPELEITLNIKEVRGSLAAVVNAISFGAYGHVIEIVLPNPQSPIGRPHLIRNFGIFTADLKGRRFFTHLEIHGQADAAAWDERTIQLRVEGDLRRDLASLLADPTQGGGGLMSFGHVPDWRVPHWLIPYSDRLARLGRSIEALRAALQNRAEVVEAEFHELLLTHPLLLDVYGICESKPRFIYPDGARSPVGKASLEPDFLVRYSDQSYKLIEIERPSKNVVTAQGQPRAEVTQAAFQCAEWLHFIKTHYQTLVARYPEIQARCKTAVIMSRTNQLSFKGVDDISTYKGLMAELYRIDEFYTYDDLYDRARTAYDLLSGLLPSGAYSSVESASPGMPGSTSHQDR